MQKLEPSADEVPTAARMLADGAPRFESALRSISRTLAAQGLVLERYRRSALLRRIRRRSQGRGVQALESYAKRLAEDPAEVAELVRAITRPSDLLFRDIELLAALRRILPERLGGALFPQLWVPDCGSGEEVYALAMALEDLLAQAEVSADFIVYGTDTDIEALQQARSGRFLRTVASMVPKALRERFLTPSANSGELSVIRELGRRCQFMVHSLSAPSPFLDLTLILCRDLLLYLAPALQRRVIEHLHQALQPNGLLLIGTPDEPLAHEDLFMPHPQAPGLYVKRERSAGIVLRDAGIGRAIDPYAAVFRNTAVPLLLLDDTAHIVDANLSASLRFDELGPLLGRPLTSLIAAADHVRLNAMLARVGAGLAERFDVGLIDAGTALLEVRAVSRHPDRVLVAVLTHQETISLAATRRLDALLGTLSHGVMLSDSQQRIVDMNEPAERLTGCPRLEALGQSLAQVFRIEPIERGEADDAVLPATLSETPQEFWLSHRDGRRLAIVASLKNLDEVGEVLVFEDVSEHKLMSAELAYRSTHDPVTGLLNRETFETRVRAAHAEAHRGGVCAVLCYIDVDQFKLINDTLGHIAGDELLRELATELRVIVGGRDTLARLGGDEFGVLLSAYDLRSARPIVDALMVAARRFRFHWNGQSYAVTISIGASLIDALGENVTHALSMADAACFAAKDAGRDRARFAGEDDELARRYIDMSLVGKLGRALDEGRFELYVEDVVPIDQPGRVVYRELLVRMREEDGRLTAPAAFIQAAERFFLMAALDRWVLRSAFRGVARLPADDVIYAVNLSGQSLSDENFRDYVLGELEDSGVDPQRICFEITETAAVSRMTEAVRFISEVSKAGCRFALDDFGAGMASFSYLKSFDVDFLKIDGSFVRSILDNRVDRGMVESINRIGHQMGLRTIAEHVESEALLAPLRAIGVDWAQGRGIAWSRPFQDLLKHS